MNCTTQLHSVYFTALRAFGAVMQVGCLLFHSGLGVAKMYEYDRIDDNIIPWYHEILPIKSRASIGCTLGPDTAYPCKLT